MASASLRPRSRERPPEAGELAEIRRRARVGLVDNLLAFWMLHGSDDEHGGFINNLDRTGRPVGSTDKYLVFQARLVWTLAAAHRHGLPDGGYLAAAGRGARFLVDRMWDPAAGGFVWSVRRDGALLDRRKLVLGQAFAIFALAEYALAAGSAWALDWATRTLDVVADRAGDGELGFREAFDGEWRPLPGLLGTTKSVNVHLHLLEALTTLVEASGQPAHTARLRCVIDLLLARAIDPRDRYAVDEPFDREWCRLSPRGRPRRVSYGHAVELAWLGARALDRLHDSSERARALLLGLIDHTLDYGFDHRRGGLARWGPPVGAVRYAPYVSPAWRVKHWWEQAELLPATLLAYRWTGQTRYLTAFARQFRYVWLHQMDHACGEWFEATAWRDGRPLGTTKAHEWKDPYHEARALMEVSTRLADLVSPRGEPAQADELTPGSGAGPDRLAGGAGG
jgi:mannose 2-epimerase